jgi:hypothetical protein
MHSTGELRQRYCRWLRGHYFFSAVRSV